MKQVKKEGLLKYAQNEYIAAMVAAKLARRLNAMEPADRPDPYSKVTSLALKLVSEGRVKYEIPEVEKEPESSEDGEEK